MMMRVRWKLTVASLKMFTRQKEAIIWTMLLPLFMIFLFGFVSFEGLGKIRLGLAGQETPSVSRLVEALQGVRTLELNQGSERSELDRLKVGERHLVLVVPDGFDPGEGHDLKVLVNDAKPQETQLGLLILR